MLIGVIALSGCTQNQNAIIIQNSTFNPNQKNITTGTTVTWINNDSKPHKIVSNDGVFESGTLNPGDKFDYAFYGVGEFGYHDALNSSMTGKITVTQAMGF